MESALFPKRKRNRNRLAGYDYAQPNYYFVTVCVQNRSPIFWCQPPCRGAYYAPEEVPLSQVGKTVEQAIANIPLKYESVMVDKYVIMPNHVHLILIFQSDVCGRAMHAPTLSTVIGQMKGYVTKTCGFSFWQKSFYDEIIRTQKGYEEIWNYIDGNPLKWQDDEYYIIEKGDKKCTQI